MAVTLFYQLTSAGLAHSIRSQFGGFAAHWGLSCQRRLDEPQSWALSSGLHPDTGIRSIHGHSSNIFGGVTVDWAAQTVRAEFVGEVGVAKLNHTLSFATRRSSTQPCAQLTPLVRDVCAGEVAWANSPRPHPLRLGVWCQSVAALCCRHGAAGIGRRGRSASSG